MLDINFFFHCRQFTQESYLLIVSINMQGAQWLSGRVLDSRPKGRGFQPHRRHWVVSLSKTQLSLLSTGSTQEDPSLRN